MSRSDQRHGLRLVVKQRQDATGLQQDIQGRTAVAGNLRQPDAPVFNHDVGPHVLAGRVSLEFLLPRQAVQEALSESELDHSFHALVVVPRMAVDFIATDSLSRADKQLVLKHNARLRLIQSTCERIADKSGHWGTAVGASLYASIACQGNDVHAIRVEPFDVLGGLLPNATVRRAEVQNVVAAEQPQPVGGGMQFPQWHGVIGGERDGLPLVTVEVVATDGLVVRCHVQFPTRDSRRLPRPPCARKRTRRNQHALGTVFGLDPEMPFQSGPSNDGDQVAVAVEIDHIPISFPPRRVHHVAELQRMEFLLAIDRPKAIDADRQPFQVLDRGDRCPLMRVGVVGTDLVGRTNDEPSALRYHGLDVRRIDVDPALGNQRPPVRAVEEGQSAIRSHLDEMVAPSGKVQRTIAGNSTVGVRVFRVVDLQELAAASQESTNPLASGAEVDGRLTFGLRVACGA